MQLNYELDKAAIGQRFRLERRRRKMTQEEMAEVIGVTSKYLSKVENGNKSPSLTFALKFSDFTGVSLDYLLKGLKRTEQVKPPAQENHYVYEDIIFGEKLSKKQKKICDAVIRKLTETLIENDV